MAQNTDIATRALIVTLKSPLVGMKTADVVKKVGCSARQVQRIYGRAIQRGFDLNQTPFILKDEWLQDAPRSGRLTKQTPETTKAIVAKVQHDRYGRERTCADLAGELSQMGLDISATIIWRILKKNGYRKTKPTRKPGLTKVMRAERLQWCLAHQDWTLED